MVKGFAPAVLIILSGAILNCATAPRETGIRDGALHRFTRVDEKTYRFDYNSPVTYNIYSQEKVAVPENYTPLKRQFRAAWVAVVWNLNFPQTSSEVQYKKEFEKILNNFDDYNMNAVIFQLRTSLDVFYPSDVYPWSQYVTGVGAAARQGVDPGFDPLGFMVEQTHKHGMEFHAWLNPYRVYPPYNDQTISGKTAVEIDGMSNEELLKALRDAGKLALNNFAVLNPQYVYRFDRRLWMDAGVPAVNEEVAFAVKELIEKYDVDAIHFDDFFYPYGAADARFVPEVEALNYRLYSNYPGLAAGAKEAREQWRRDNVNKLIKGCKAVIDAENKKNNRAIQFGISPFGVWHRNPPEPRGANIGAGQMISYTDALYADSYEWVKQGWIDHIIPQLYWSIDFAQSPYGELLRWWSNLVEGTNVELYIGHGNYAHIERGERDPSWMNPEEIPNQLRLNQLYPNVKGSVFYSYTHMLPIPNWMVPVTKTEPYHKVVNESIKSIKAMYQLNKPLVPPKPWQMPSAPAAPIDVRQNRNVISWNDTKENNTRYYVVYRVPVSEGMDPPGIIEDPMNIIARVWRSGESQSFTDTVRGANLYTYAVTSLNAAHVESEPKIAAIN